MIRVRAEADQFLLSCHTIETFVRWLQALFAAIDLAPPLDDRALPRDLSIPRPRRRRTVGAPLERNVDLIRQQQEIISSQFPRLGETPVPEEASSAEQTPPTPQATPPSRPMPLRNRSSMVPLAMGVCTAESTLSDPPHPSISPSTGKWAPQTPSSPWSELQYAKRCMGILTLRTPRKSNLVIMKGKRFVIDWATGRLTRWVPPATEELPQYGELGLEKIIAETERQDETWQIGHDEGLMRV